MRPGVGRVRVNRCSFGMTSRDNFHNAPLWHISSAIMRVAAASRGVTHGLLNSGCNLYGTDAWFAGAFEKLAVAMLWCVVNVLIAQWVADSCPVHSMFEGRRLFAPDAVF